MGRKYFHERRAAEVGARVNSGTYDIDTGFAELVPDPYTDKAWILLVNGMQSSHIVEGDPLRLEFEYMQWMATCVHEWLAQYRREEIGRADTVRKNIPALRVMHLGGGACSMARYMVVRYPRSRHVVIELDKKLGEYVRHWFGLPKAPALRIRAGDARAAVENMRGDCKDIVIRDVFSGRNTSFKFATVEFVEQVRRVLKGNGLYVANVGDGISLKRTRYEAAAADHVFNHVYIIADSAMLKGKRCGNTVIVASNDWMDLRPLAAELRHSSFFSGAFPAIVWSTDKVRRFIAGVKPLHDTEVQQGS